MKGNLKSLKRLRLAVLASAALAAGICYSCGPREGESQPIVLLSEEASGEGAKEGPAGETKPQEGEPETAGQAVCFVHVCGQVNAPGVYELEEGSRVYEAIERAGGFGPSAEQGWLNLAEPVTDGMKIQVPTVQEAQEMRQSGAAAPGEKAAAGGKVNINTAGKEALMTLTGIGEARAADIISYRETQGPFEKIEDIMKVSGIKEAAFQKIKDSITV